MFTSFLKSGDASISTKTNFRFPQVDGAKITATRESVALGIEDNRCHTATMSFKSGFVICRFRIPQTNGGVLAAASKRAAIGTENNGSYRIFMPLKG